jgi:hypothetical protein
MSTNLMSPILNPWAIRGITRAPAGSTLHSISCGTSSLKAHTVGCDRPRCHQKPSKDLHYGCLGLSVHP